MTSEPRRWVLDASALLAYLHGEPGGERVSLAGNLISSVNWSEVVQKAIAYGTDMSGLRQDLEALGLTIVSFGADEAETAAALRPPTRRAGLSLGDRACLATGMVRQLPVLTADRPWADLELETAVEVIR